jgi:hypothetical protein
MHRDLNKEEAALTLTLRVHADLAAMKVHDALRYVKIQADSTTSLKIPRIEL